MKEGRLIVAKSYSVIMLRACVMLNHSSNLTFTLLLYKLWIMALISICSLRTAEYGSFRSIKKFFTTVISWTSATQIPL